MATPRVAAGVLFRSEQGLVLLVKPTYKDGWDLPGGYVEPGESPAAAAQREIREELGLPVRAGGLLVIDWAPHPREGDKLLFVFDGGVLSDAELGAAVLDLAEIGQAAFHPAEALDALTPARLARRIRLALAATDGHECGVYAELGQRTTTPGR
jgi:8-oxo-dGTP diphosphatase